MAHYTTYMILAPHVGHRMIITFCIECKSVSFANNDREIAFGNRFKMRTSFRIVIDEDVMHRLFTCELLNPFGLLSRTIGH